MAVGVGVGEQPSEQHLVGARADAGDHVGRLEGGLLDLGEVVLRVAVEHQATDLVQRVVLVRPHLREVEGVEPVVGGLLEAHDLHVQRPGRVLAACDRTVAGLRRWKSGSSATIAFASASVRHSTPWSVLKWYLTQKRSPPALVHM